MTGPLAILHLVRGVHLIAGETTHLQEHNYNYNYNYLNYCHLCRLCPLSCLCPPHWPNWVCIRQVASPVFINRPHYCQIRPTLPTRLLTTPPRLEEQTKTSPRCHLLAPINHFAIIMMPSWYQQQEIHLLTLSWGVKGVLNNVKKKLHNL